MVDRHEDVTDPNEIEKDGECDRSVILYGYVRGSHLKPGQKVHMIGVGDFGMSSVSVLPDPCEIPDKEQERKVGLYFFGEARGTILWHQFRPFLNFSSYQSYFRH